MEIHQDDLLFFHDVATTMRAVAAEYKLFVKSISHYPMPASGMVDCKGDCSHDGNIRLVMRCTENGQWCAAPRTPASIWQTAAHELAHLRHFNHGVEFQEFQLELEEAIKNHQHRNKMIKKLAKLRESRASEAQVGTAAAAEAFASMINKLMLDYELSPSDIDYARSDSDPVIEVKVDLGAYKIRQQKTRIAWQETLAGIVAQAHLCTFLLRPKSNDIWFVGTKSHAVYAEYAYGTLVPVIDKLSDVEYYAFLGKCQREGNSSRAHGYRPAWLKAFVLRIEERFKEARQAAIYESPTSESTALMRLNGALQKVNRYIDDKFSGHRRTASALAAKVRYHAEGRAAGRAAADRVALGRRGLEGGVAKQLGDGR